MGIFYLAGSVNTSYTWQVPIDWNNADNQIVCIGGGAAGVSNGTGGGGGACAILNNVTLAPGALLYWRIGGGGTTSGASGVGTWLNITGANAQPSTIAQGCYAEGGTGIVGGRASASIGNNTQSGGSASSNNSSGGGGAGGTQGPGGTSAAASPSAGAAGGILSGGAGGASATSGNATAGSPGTAFAATQAWSGPSQSYVSAVINVGSGGGGGGLSGSGSGAAGSGGIYGGGGGGCATTKTQGSGAQGGIIIRYTPSSSYTLQSTAPITLNDINSVWMASGNQIALGDPEVRYMIKSGAYNATNMPLPALSNIDLNTALGKPTTAGGSVTYSTPGLYTLYMPVYKYFSGVVSGAGGGEAGGSGTYAVCQTAGCACFNSCILCFNPISGTYFNWCTGTACYTSSPGSTGGSSSLTYTVAGGSPTTVVTATGGSGGTGITSACDTTAGSSGSGTISIGTGSVGTGGGGAGGTGASNGAAGGNGGLVNLSIQHYVTTNYPIWANNTGVTQYTITVGQGGAGGVAGTNGVAGANGSNGSVTIKWV